MQSLPSACIVHAPHGAEYSSASVYNVALDCPSACNLRCFVIPQPGCLVCKGQGQGAKANDGVHQLWVAYTANSFVKNQRPNNSQA